MWHGGQWYIGTPGITSRDVKPVKNINTITQNPVVFFRPHKSQSPDT